MDALYAFSPTGWSYFIGSSLLIGALVLCAAKGTARQRKWDNGYLYAILLMNLSTLLIYQLEPFFFLHWPALVTLLAIPIGYWTISANRPWLLAYPMCVAVSSYTFWRDGVVVLIAFAVRTRSVGEILTTKPQLLKAGGTT